MLVPPRFRSSLLAVLTGAAAPVAAQDAAPAPDFAREVLPVLSDRCFTCHGPDPTSRRAGLRLDLAAEARDSGVLELDGEGASELVQRILDDDPSFRMPPPEAKNELTEAERDVLRRWVAAGAPYGRHWAFLPLPGEVAVPDAGGAWALSPIDRFVAARHGERGLEPAPAAAPARWLRRVSYDLTGLPPTPEELDGFLADPSPAARAAVVDRLLASPAFGERMATPWLDVARYADSYGYQADLLSPTWPYRDWVVRSFNAGLPYDRFLVEQLAGDLLEEPSRDQRLATAFNRLHRMTNEGGSVEAERRHESVVDRVETLGAAVMGLTLGCARCHDHKFDPISQADFYGLYACFSGIEEWGMYHDSARVPTPSLLLPTPEQEQQLRELEDGVREAEAALAERLDAPAPELAPGASAAVLGPDPSEPGELGPAAVVRFVGGEAREGGGLRFPAEGGAEAGAVVPWGVEPGELAEREGVVLDGERAVQVEGVGPFGPTDAFTLELELTLPEGARRAVLAHRTGGTDVGVFGFDLTLEDGFVRARQVRFWPGNAAAVVSEQRVPTGRRVRIVYAQTGSGWADGMALWVDGAPGQEELVDRLGKMPGRGPGGVGGGGLALGARFRDVGAAGAVVHGLRYWRRALGPFDVARALDPSHGVGGDGLVDDGRRAAAARHLVQRSPEVRAARARLAAARRGLLDARGGVVEVPVMEEDPWAPKHAWVLARGAYDAPRTEENRVGRAVPAALAEGGGAAVEDRLALARWLVAPDHPLTARVAVNRLWQQFFGAGLVATPGDLGLQGAPPTHPRLLDWLARRFVGSGWDVKALCREIVLSATYGQDSAAAPEARRLDPDGRWLSRWPRRRLPAEMLRDTALFASGLLDPRRGGPPVSPYQPPGLWRESNSMSPAYRQGVGADLYRRSLYSVIKRTAPLPNMTVFGVPSREAPCPRREGASTPLQGLVLLNDVQFVEAARVLAARVMGEFEVDAERVAAAFRRLAGREPDEEEARVLEGLLSTEREAFAAAPEDAAALVAVGESPAAGDPVELAALTAVVQVMLNLDATVVLR